MYIGHITIRGADHLSGVDKWQVWRCHVRVRGWSIVSMSACRGGAAGGAAQGGGVSRSLRDTEGGRRPPAPRRRRPPRTPFSPVSLLNFTSCL